MLLEKRGKAIKEELTSKDREWLNNLQHCRDILRIMSHEQVNNRTLMESLAIPSLFFLSILISFCSFSSVKSAAIITSLDFSAPKKAFRGVWVIPSDPTL